MTLVTAFVAWLAAAWLTAAPPAMAELPEATPMTLERAVEEGARRGPAVVESLRTKAAASDFAKDPGASLPAVPQVTIMAGARRPYNLPLGPELSLTAQQEIAARGLGSARRNAAEWAARAALSNVERARIEGASTAGLAWLDLLEAQQLLGARIAAADDAERIARIAEVRVASGFATATERSLAAAEVGGARLAILEAEGRTVEARLSLALATGEPLALPLAASGALAPAPEPTIPARAVFDGAARHPAIAAAEAHAMHASAEATVAHATTGPFFALGATVWREGSGDHAAAALVTVPLPLFDPARYDEARQATLAAAAGARVDRLRVEVEREVRLAIHEREHSREVERQLRSHVVAPLRKALETAVASYSAGTSDLTVVLLARRSVLSAEERLVTATANVSRADLRAAALGGRLLPGGLR